MNALYAGRPAKVNWRKPPQHFAELHESPSKTKATGQPSARIMMRTSFELAIHPEGNAIFGYDGGNHFVRNGKVRPKGVFCCERKQKYFVTRSGKAS